MQGLVFDIRSFSVHDGPGIRTTVFLKGCPLRCTWCHNPESHHPDPEPMIKTFRVGEKTYVKTEMVGTWMTVEQVMERVLMDVAFYEESGGGVTFSGGEPLNQVDFLTELLSACHGYGLHTAVDTCGYASQDSFERIISLTDLFLYDLKIMDSKAHFAYTGTHNQQIIRNLRYLLSAGSKVHLRIPLVPEISDSETNIRQLHDFIQSLPPFPRIDLLPFHNTASRKYHQLKQNNPLDAASSYDGQRASEIRTFFSNLAPVVSIGG